ncbi:MAG: mechanosensitive ion channel domain-containing protein [Phycisphaerales bacterium]
MPETLTWIDWAWTAALLVGAALGGLVAHAVLGVIIGRIVRRTPSKLDEAAAKYAYKPTRLIFPTLAAQLFVPSLPLPPGIREVIWHALSILLIVGVAWLLISMTKLLEDLVQSRHDIKATDNLEARRVVTQVRLLRRTAEVVIVIIGMAVVLMTFPRVRELGGSLLASAGLAGIVVGFAARPVLQNIIAGVQLALTQPIRIDDVVVIEGEFGWVEEIGSTFVVIRIWDKRRLVVPLNYFIENIFQNWTRTTADILGAVFLHVDYTAPLEAMRQEVRRLVEGNPLWDKAVAGLQVVDVSEQTVKLRILVSAASAPAAWDLRCHVREGLIEFLQRNHPTALPRVRAQLSGVPGGPDGALALQGA